ncbi:MAG TPA: hypothetical protein VIF62_27810 [Labilithrix sp.]
MTLFSLASAVHTGCSSSSTSTASGDGGYGTTSSSSGSSGLQCPDPSLRLCSSASDCCTGFCAKISTGDGMQHCTLECTTNSDCVASDVWHGSGAGCNPITGHCSN